MNKQQTAEVIKILKGFYPYTYKDYSKVELDKVVNNWTALFADDDFRIVGEAVIALCKTRTSTFPPVPGEITAYMDRIKNPQEMTEMEAWAIVKRAISNSAYGYVEVFNKLPDTLKKLVGSPNQLHEWSTMAMDTINSVVSSNFKRSYRAKISQIKEERLLPESTKKMIKQISDKFKMIE